MSNFTLSAFADEIDMNLDVQMNVLDKHNIKYIEMRGVNGKNITECTLDEARDIKRKLDERGFKLSAIGSPIGKIKITDDFENHLKLFKHTLNIAKIMETKYIRMFSFFVEDNDREKYRDEVISRWRKFIDVAKDYDVILLHENEKDIYGDTPERIIDLFKALKCDFLKVTFDPANFVQCNVKPYNEGYCILKEYIEYVHIKDAEFISNNVVPAGYGNGEIRELLQMLNNNGFNGFLSLEPHLGYFEGLSSFELDDSWKSLPKGGERLFTIAIEALEKILKEITFN